jgi:phosphocarrier protein HPr
MPQLTSANIIITNKLGLHARASAKLTQLASKFKSEVFITKSGKKVNAKSIMGVMMLAASMGTELQIEANGIDSQDAVQNIIALFEDKFGEGE